MLRLAVAVAVALAACGYDDLGEEAIAVETDLVKACPIPSIDDIPGHESVFYRCADDHADGDRGCGDDGYLLGYGTRYAERFYRQTRPRMSPRGQRWIDDVLVCLQRDLRDSIDSTTRCDDIRTIAFDSHPACYIEAGFCSLPILDVLNVLWTIDAREWFGSDAFRQAARTAAGCSQKYASAIHFFFGDLGGSDR